MQHQIHLQYQLIDLSNTYTVDKNNEEKPEPTENSTYTFATSSIK